jgi:hypothetical protein
MAKPEIIWRMLKIPETRTKTQQKVYEVAKRMAYKKQMMKLRGDRVRQIEKAEKQITVKKTAQKQNTAAPRRMKLKDFIELHPQLPGKVTAVYLEREQVVANKKADA